MTNSLDFLKSKITYAYIDGQWWFPIKPICEALNVDFKQQKKNISSSPVLGPGGCVHTLQVGSDQSRKHYCINERRIYAWLLNMRSDKPDLLKFQVELSDKIYDMLRGSLVAISAAATIKRNAEIDIEQAKEELGSHPAYIKLRAAETRRKSANKRLTDTAIDQATLFNSPS